jgi:hypothetical protein
VVKVEEVQANVPINIPMCLELLNMDTGEALSLVAGLS